MLQDVYRTSSKTFANGIGRSGFAELREQKALTVVGAIRSTW